MHHTRHAGTAVTPSLSCVCAQFPSHMGVCTLSQIIRPIPSCFFHRNVSACPQRRSQLLSFQTFTSQLSVHPEWGCSPPLNSLCLRSHSRPNASSVDVCGQALANT